MATTLDCVVLRDLFGTPGVRAAFDSRALVQGWLDVERVLAEAEAEVGVIPEWAAARISVETDAATYDLDLLREEIADSQHPLVPLIRALVLRCGDAGRYVHWGATTQDVIDTGMVLQVRKALGLVGADVDRAASAADDLAELHRTDPMAGRTHSQHAVPISFGFKAAVWADELRRVDRRLREANDGLCAQLAGAAGTLAALGSEAGATRRAFARRLDLVDPSLPWHVARDRTRDLAHALGQLAAAAERVAAEMVRLQATEVSEVREPASPGHVGSSTMPQKRNPMVSEYIIACARLMHGSITSLQFSSAHAGERDMGLWAVEWIAVPQSLILASSIASKLASVLDDIEVNPERMSRNLDMTRGTIMAEAVMMELAHSLGHEEAHRLVSAASARALAEGLPLFDVLNDEPAVARLLTPARLAELMNPRLYLGEATLPRRAY